MSYDAMLLGVAMGWLLHMGLAWCMQRSQQRQDRRNQAQYGDDCAPNPLPMRSVERGQRFKVAGGRWPLLIGHEDDWTIWVVLDLDELPRPPAPKFADDAHGADGIAAGAA